MTKRTPMTDAAIIWRNIVAGGLETGEREPYVTADFARSLERQLSECRAENQSFRNGFDNLLAALDKAPGLPIEAQSEEDQAKWTDLITGLLMALGSYQHSGKPQSVWEGLQDAALAAKGEK